MKTKWMTTAALALCLGGAPALQAQEAPAFKNPFPSSLNIAHTWNRSLVKKAGQVIGDRISRAGVKEVAAPDLTVLAPTDGTGYLDRYSQSPYLTAELGVEMVKGLQNKEQLKAYVTFDKREKTATHVSPYGRVLKEAGAAGIATSQQNLKTPAACTGSTAAQTEDFAKTALQVAHESMTLLRNAGGVLPVDTAWVKTVAVCGDADAAADMLPALQAALACRVVAGSADKAGEADLILLFEDDVIDQARLNKLQLTGKPVALVLLNSRPVDLKAARHIPAVLEAWHPGQQGPKAIASVLSGAYNPGGKLTVEFPDFALGHGLSYTNFRYHDLTLEPSEIGTDGSVIVRFKVTNTGRVNGGEVVQVYLEDEKASVALPAVKLEACKRTNINAGQTKELKFTIRQRNMELLNAQDAWVIEPGFFTVRVGSASDDIRLQERFEVK